ncbi:MAG: hypothetical protein OHK0017_09360 [Patescibacteria group bacterium]
MLSSVKNRVLKGGLVILMSILGLMLLTTTTVHAAELYRDCTASTKLSVSNLFKPQEFVPLIPADCSGGPGTAAPALSLNSISVVILRGYGFLASLTFYFFIVNLIFASIRWSYAAFDTAQAGQALQSIQEGGVSLILILVSHLVLSTIFNSIFKVEGGFSTSLTGFFS